MHDCAEFEGDVDHALIELIGDVVDKPMGLVGRLSFVAVAAWSSLSRWLPSVVYAKVLRSRSG